MNYKITKVNEDNYHMFDDMVYWRINGIERTYLEKEENRKTLIIPQELTVHNFRVYALERDHKFIGWISLNYLAKVGKKNCKGYIYIDELWIEESYRRLGYAQALMEKADDYSNELETVGIRLGVNVNNPSALKLYEKCGYISTSQAYTMEKRRSIR